MVDGRAQRAGGRGGAHDVLALEQPRHCRLADREQAEDHRPVRDGLVAGNADTPAQRAAAACGDGNGGVSVGHGVTPAFVPALPCEGEVIPPLRSDAVAKPELGTKRVCPTTGRKFYDLNKDPIVSPYTGQSYPRSMFEPQAKAAAVAAAKPDEDEDEVEVVEIVAAPDEPEVISLEDADAEEAGEEEVIPDVEDVEDVEDLGDDDADAFLEEDEEEDENLDFDVGGGDER
eukprot:gene47024-62968_t